MSSGNSWNTRHFSLPFDPREKGVRIFSGEACNMLLNIFPGTTDLFQGRHGAYLHFGVSELPKTPWPLTIGGSPFTVTDGMHGRGPLFPKQRLSPLSNKSCRDFDASTDDFSDNDLRAVAADVAQELPDEVKASFSELIFTYDRGFYVVLGGNSNTSGVWSCQMEDAGDDAVRISDSAHGSAVRGNDSEVIGLFQYQIVEGPWAGFCAIAKC